MNYRFIGQSARFYPDIRDHEGKSLMATEGTVFGFEDIPPSDGLWVPLEDAEPLTQPTQEAPEPEPAAVAAEPVPEPPAVDPEPVQAPAPVASFSFPPVGPAFPLPGYAPAVQPFTR